MHDWLNWHNWRFFSNFHLFVPFLKYGIGILTGWGAYSAQQWRQNHRRSHASGWIPVQPTILTAQLARQQKERRKFAVEIGYEYAVQDNYFSGKHVELLRTKDSAESFAYNLGQTKIPVWYNPSKPSESVLDENSLKQLIPSDSLLSG
jgi:hypothetical protein